ncbi:MAG: FAD-binding protein [Syntrophobacteraceae bacterium]|nr:FAD-binding protein [Syntrophobacteraceae bacterium]
MFYSSPPYSPITPQILADIRNAVGEDALIEDPAKLEEYGKDATDHRQTPAIVVRAVSAAQVQALLRLANVHRFPVTPRGLGTGLAGGSVPSPGGVVLSLERMNRILSIDTDNLIAVVEPGVINLDLKKAAQSKGLFYPPDPASLETCSIGGNAATNAGGPACIKYGTTRDYVLGLEAVLPTGEIMEMGVQTRKGVVGYDLTHLMVGSEGTLGVITRLILKLIPNPVSVNTLVVLFPELSMAMKAVTSILVSGHIPSALEFLDRRCLELVGDLLPFEGARDAAALLVLEVDGLPGITERELEKIGEICLENGALDAFFAPDSHKRSQMWEVRRQVSVRIERDWPLYVPEDVVVPIGRIADFVDGLPALEELYEMKIYSFGHAGDGNIHVSVTAESRDLAGKVEKGIRAVLARALSMGGTISGEHGIGIAKKQFLPMELSTESIRIQKEIKRIFDPNMILNPGKIFD